MKVTQAIRMISILSKVKALTNKIIFANCFSLADGMKRKKKGEINLHNFIELKSVILIFSMFLLFSSDVIAQEGTAASLLTKKVEIFNNFFSSSPILITKMRSTQISSPTGYKIEVTKFENCRISYNAQKTNSIISPYIGYILLDTRILINNCGDLESSDSKHYHFSSIELARKKKKNAHCYETLSNRKFKFIFTFQNNKWVFKNVIIFLTEYQIEYPAYNVAAALGIPDPDRYYVKDKKNWEILIK